jgi:hypothetical protein
MTNAYLGEAAIREAQLFGNFLYWLRPDEIKQLATSKYSGIAVHHVPFREPGFAKGIRSADPLPHAYLAISCGFGRPAALAAVEQMARLILWMHWSLFEMLVAWAAPVRTAAGLGKRCP